MDREEKIRDLDKSSICLNNSIVKKYKFNEQLSKIKYRSIIQNETKKKNG